MSQNSPNNDRKISYEKMRAITSDPAATIHFVGVGGVSMYSLARLALLGGAKISGSDREESARTRELSLFGARIAIGHSRDNVKGASLVVYTHAISADNPELTEARAAGIPIVSRAEYMGALMLGYTKRIGVSGSHGKSSTVAMLDCIFSQAMCQPTVLSGAELTAGEPLKVGSKNLMIYEACEYKDSFLKFSPTISVGLNLELDHTDYFTSLQEMRSSFTKALGKATSFSVICGDDENLMRIRHLIKTRVVTFGRGENNDYRYTVTAFLDRGFEFSIEKQGLPIGKFRLNIPGIFNVSNAVAAIVVAMEYGIDASTAAEAIEAYRGISRRLEYIGSRYGRAVYYDYAHHPTEIAASVNALKMLTHDYLTVLFKPHTYTRTRSLWQELRAALSLADRVILTDIYPAREEPIEGITSQRLAEDIGPTAEYCSDEDAVRALDQRTVGTIVLMGAGDLERIKYEVLNKYF